jgi:hypothetical protein
MAWTCTALSVQSGWWLSSVQVGMSTDVASIQILQALQTDKARHVQNIGCPKIRFTEILTQIPRKHCFMYNWPPALSDSEKQQQLFNTW